MYIEKIEDMPAEALAVIKKKYPEDEFETVEDICYLIREANNGYDETTDSCYITCTYHMTIDDWRFEVDGNSYRKDQSVCDEELEDGFTLISIEQQKKDYQSKQKADKAKSDESWRALLDSISNEMSPENVFNMLKDYKFPNKW